MITLFIWFMVSAAVAGGAALFVEMMERKDD